MVVGDLPVVNSEVARLAGSAADFSSLLGILPFATSSSI
jgi:hypothetical protein